MSTQTIGCATFDDLMKTDGKAELINGRIVTFMATGALPSRVAKRILLALDPFVTALGIGEVFGDSLGYAIRPALSSGRQSFSPDVSYFVATARNAAQPPRTYRFRSLPSESASVLTLNAIEVASACRSLGNARSSARSMPLRRYCCWSTGKIRFASLLPAPAR